MFGNIYNRLRRITSNQLYFPEIDGIRFLAIVLVVLFHIHGYFVKKSVVFTDRPHEYGALNTLLSNGDRGVELFFVLSGFILCLPFAHHYINKGKKVSLKKYYLRRVTRLEPPYFLAMTGIFLLAIATHVYPTDSAFPGWIPSWLASLSYSHDLIYHHVPFLTVVAWSLEIEIQFYLLAPLFFSVLALNKVTRRVILVCGAVAIIWLQQIYPPGFLNLYGFAQYFFAGILLADLYVSDAASGIFNKKWMVATALICAVLVLCLPIKNKELPDGEQIAVRTGFLLSVALLYYAVFKNDVLRKIFSYRFVPIIGGMCYSIYLLHYTVISFAGRYTGMLRLTNYYLPNLVLQIVLLGIPVLLLSAVFYYYVERPFMSRKWMEMLMKKDRKEEETNVVS